MTTPPPPTSFAHQAAKLSWVCPIIVFGVVAFGKRAGAPLIVDLIAFLLMIVGFGFGVIALFCIPKHGTKGILAPAIAGLLINGLLLFIFATNFLAARARAKENRHTEVPRVVLVAQQNSAPTDPKIH